MDDLLEREKVRVGDDVISPERIAEEMQHHSASDAAEAWEEAARALVVRKLLLNEARQQGLEAGDLRDGEGRVLNEEDALIEVLLEQEISVPQANENEARRFYDLRRENFSNDTLIEAEHIFFSASPDDSLNYNMALSDARALILALKKEPHRFADLAASHSACPSKEQGGRLGQISHGQTVPEFEEVLFALGEGELAEEPVRSRYGVHVVRAGRRAEAEQIPFEQVDASIRTYLEEATYRRGLAQYLSILASRTEIEGVALPMADGPLVQ
jgi:peptidyl-prolyl cis-trans isomerase C